MRARGAARGVGDCKSAAVIVSFEGASVVRGRRPMLARCRFRAVIVAVVIIAKDFCMRGEGGAFSEIGAPRSVGASSAGVRAGIRRG